MDPVTLIVAAVATGAAAGVGDLVKQAGSTIHTGNSDTYSLHRDHLSRLAGLSDAANRNAASSSSR